MSTRITDLTEGETVKGVVHRCPICGELFIGRADARFCSVKCRVQKHRSET